MATTAGTGNALFVLLVATTGVGASETSSTEQPRQDCRAVSNGTESTIEASPRRDRAIEMLGLTLTEDMVVPDALYRRLKRDIEAIKARNPRLASIEHRHRYDASSLIIVAEDAATAEAIRNDNYQGLHCMEQRFGESAAHPMFRKYFDLRLQGVYDMRQLGALYAELPGIAQTNLNLNVGDGSTITATRDGETYTYRFARKWGTCVSGCLKSRVWEYQVGPRGEVQLMDRPAEDAPRPPSRE